MVSQPRTCGNDDCNLADDGKCVEGYELDECPHVGRISMDDIEVVPDDAEDVVEPEATMQLRSGEPLNRDTASKLQRRRLSRGMGLIGPNDSGKTSLIAGLYDLFQAGPVSGVSFAGSSTLIGFENVCHLARAVSRRVNPHTERTIVGADATFFHLDLHREGEDIVSLFIGDRSGEDYLSASDELARAEEFFELRRADCVTLLVNGEQLADGEKRHDVKAITPQIVEALVEAKSVREGCRLAIVLTKKDVVVSSPHVERIEREFEELVAQIRGAHSDYMGEIRAFTVAASPQDCERVTRGEGIGELLLFWLETATAPMTRLPRSRDTMPRMMDRFGHGGRSNDE